MESPHCQEHQTFRKHPKQCSTLCTPEIWLEHQCYGPQVRPQLSQTSTMLQDPWPYHVVHFATVNIDLPSPVLPHLRNFKDRLCHDLLICPTSRFITEWNAWDMHSLSEPFLSGTPSLYRWSSLLRWIASSAWQQPTVNRPSSNSSSPRY